MSDYCDQHPDDLTKCDTTTEPSDSGYGALFFLAAIVWVPSFIVLTFSRVIYVAIDFEIYYHIPRSPDKYFTDEKVFKKYTEINIFEQIASLVLFFYVTRIILGDLFEYIGEFYFWYMLVLFVP